MAPLGAPSSAATAANAALFGLLENASNVMHRPANLTAATSDMGQDSSGEEGEEDDEQEDFVPSGAPKEKGIKKPEAAPLTDNLFEGFAQDVPQGIDGHQSCAG